MKTGIIGIVQEDLDHDFFAAAMRLRSIGYQGIEAAEGSLAKLDADDGRLAERLVEIDMTLVAAHVTKYDFLDRGEALVDGVATMGAQRLCMAWGPADSADQIREDAALYNRIGSLCRDRGLELTYHNHDHEFAICRETGGRYLDLLLAETDPDRVGLHFDVAWCLFGGADPVAHASEYAGRVSVLHLKDLKGLEPGCESAAGDRQAARFTEVGDGIVPIGAILEAAASSRAAWQVVEQDRPGDLDPWPSAERSYTNLSRPPAATGV